MAFEPDLEGSTGCHRQREEKRGAGGPCVGALICVPSGSNPAQRLRQRHIYSGAAYRRVSWVTETNQGCWPARGGSCYPPWAEGTKGGNRVSRACESWGGEAAASSPGWYLPLAEPSGGVSSGGVQGRAERRIPREEEKSWVQCH